MLIGWVNSPSRTAKKPWPGKKVSADDLWQHLVNIKT